MAATPASIRAGVSPRPLSQRSGCFPGRAVALGEAADYGHDLVCQRVNALVYLCLSPFEVCLTLSLARRLAASLGELGRDERQAQILLRDACHRVRVVRCDDGGQICVQFGPGVVDLHLKPFEARNLAKALSAVVAEPAK